jgi:hypothetical protein
MSRLRKGKKYQGGRFAGQFKSAMTMKSPLYEVAVAGEITEQEIELPASPELKEKTGDLIKSGASKATTENIGDKDIVMESSPDTKTVHEDKPDQVEKKVGSGVRRTAREDYFTANKEKQKEAADAKTAEDQEAKDAEEAMTYRNADGEMVFMDDYEEGSKGKDRRKEHRNNKGEIKDEFKEDKARLKEMRDSGEISKKEYKEMLKGEKAEKKGLKKSSKTLKKSNRQDTKAARKAAKRARKGK